jgi:hypothetical protein
MGLVFGVRKVVQPLLLRHRLSAAPAGGPIALDPQECGGLAGTTSNQALIKL